MKVIGEVKLVGMLEDRPEIIWKKMCHSGGINKMAYADYFKGKDKVIAYMLGKVEELEDKKFQIILQSGGISINKQILCPECREHSDYIIKKERKKYIIRNKEYHFNITVGYCKNCDKELDIPGLMDLQMKEVDEQYKKEENIVSINEIKNL